MKKILKKVVIPKLFQIVLDKLCFIWKNSGCGGGNLHPRSESTAVTVLRLDCCQELECPGIFHCLVKVALLALKRPTFKRLEERVWCESRAESDFDSCEITSLFRSCVKFLLVSGCYIGIQMEYRSIEYF